MQSRVAKSLYLGLAALSFGAVATMSTTASAKSKAKIVSTQNLKTDATTRNVAVTGSNAIYSKPGTVKGARVVASKSKVKKLAASKKSADYFRAYAVAKTNKGSVYFKVVAMNGKYRGYVYGGKDVNTFAGGLKSVETLTPATMPTDTIATFAQPGKGNVTWSAPKYTQYKASKNVKDTTPFAKDQLKITKAATKTREGSLYYYVEDAKNPSINGWIYSGALKLVTSQDLAAQNGVTLTYINKTNVTTVASKVVALPKTAKDDTMTNADVAKAAQDATNLPAGYTYAELASTADVKKGGSMVVYVTPNASANLTVTPKVYNADLDRTKAQAALDAYWKTNKVADTLAKDSFFTQPEKTQASASDLEAALNRNQLGTFVYVDQTQTVNDGKDYVAYRFTLNHANAGTYADKSATDVFYTATKGSVAISTTTGAFTPSK